MSNLFIKTSRFSIFFSPYKLLLCLLQIFIYHVYFTILKKCIRKFRSYLPNFQLVSIYLDCFKQFTLQNINFLLILCMNILLIWKYHIQKYFFFKSRFKYKKIKFYKYINIFFKFYYFYIYLKNFYYLKKKTLKNNLEKKFKKIIYKFLLSLLSATCDFAN